MIQFWKIEKSRPYYTGRHNPMMNKRIIEITERIVDRSKAQREKYLQTISLAPSEGSRRNQLSCGNLAHGFAGCGATDKAMIAEGRQPNIGIITAYRSKLAKAVPMSKAAIGCNPALPLQKQYPITTVSSKVSTAVYN